MTSNGAEQSGFQVRGNAPEHYQRSVGMIMAPLVEAVVSRAGVAPGMNVLDLACGTGFVARSAAPLLGDSALPLAADFALPAESQQAAVDEITGALAGFRVEDGRIRVRFTSNLLIAQV